MANTIFTISLVSFSAAYLNCKFHVVDFGFLPICLVVFSVQIAFYGFYLLVIYPRFFHPLRYVPRAADCHPLWGHTLKVLGSPSGFPHAKWIEQQQEDSDFLYSSFAGSDRLVATSSRAAAAVLQSSAEDMGQSTITVRLFERIMGRTLLTASGAEHKELRKSFWPAFAPDNIRKLSPNIWNASLRLRDAISNSNFGDLSDGVYRRIDFWPLVHDGAMRVILEIALSIDLDNDPMGQELLECYHDLLPLHQDPSIIKNMILLAQGMLLPLDWAVASNRRIRTIYEGQQTASRIYRALAEKRLTGEKSPNSQDLLDKMCQNQYNKDIDHAVRQLNIMMAAGHETTACAALWALYEISKNPDIQQKLRDEISTVMPDPDAGASDATQINSLPYLHSFLMEIFRLYPSVPQMNKKALNDLVLCGQRIPKGTPVQVPVYALNRSKDIWGPDAHEFRPERWMKSGDDAALPAANPKSLHSFAQGPHSCPGREFATRVIKCFLAVLLSSFEFETVPGETPEFAKALPTLRPITGVELFARPLRK